MQDFATIHSINYGEKYGLPSPIMLLLYDKHIIPSYLNYGSLILKYGVTLSKPIYEL